MIKIKKGNHILTVSHETYKSMFKIIGYEIVNDEEVNKASSEETNNPTTDILEKEPENSNEVDELDTFLEEVSNLPKEEKEVIKEEPEEELKVKEEKEVAKSEGNLENILDMLSKKEDNKKIGNKKNNKEEK